MDFTQDKYSALWTIEEMKILGAVLELQAKPQNWAKLAKSAVLFSQLLQNGSQDFYFFNCLGCRIFILCEIHCYLCPHIFWVYYFSLSQCVVLVLLSIFFPIFQQTLFRFRFLIQIWLLFGDFNIKLSTFQPFSNIFLDQSNKLHCISVL